MPVPTPDEFWQSLVTVRLLDAETAGRLRSECPAAGVDAVKAAAAWLVDRGVLTRWQAKRLAAGDHGPFVVGDYRLLERHDRDGDSHVFTARHEPSGRLVTLVLLSPRRCRDGEAWTAIVKRTQAATAARDPMLSGTWTLEHQDGSRFIACEAVAGTNLADEVERLGPLPAREAGVLAVQVAKAVAALHDLCEVHGGLSLDVLRRESPPPAGGERHGRVRLLQFPQAYDAHLVPPRAEVANEAEVERLGRRAAFVAPELLEQGAVCDARSDVYALGAIVYALLAGRGPCWTGIARSTLERAAGDGPEPLPATVPPAVASLVGTMLASDPARRPATAAEAADALARVMGFEPRAATASSLGTAATARAPAVGPVAPRSPARGRPAWWRSWPAGIAATLLAAAAVGFVLARMGDEKPRRVAKRPRPPVQADERAGDRVGKGEAGAESRAATAVHEPAPPPAPPARQTLVDDPTLPWASPTDGPPPTLAYLPPGSQLVLRARLADLAASGEG
ncbi:MAG: protein kinase domain-containing protein, partial [Planctomycetaceae bacterium]